MQSRLLRVWGVGLTGSVDVRDGGKDQVRRWGERGISMPLRVVSGEMRSCKKTSEMGVRGGEVVVAALEAGVWRAAAEWEFRAPLAVLGGGRVFLAPLQGAFDLKRC